MTNLRSRRRGARLGAAVIALALTASACGAEREAADASAPADDATQAVDAATSWGDLESPCGDGDGGGATDQGVEADKITIGYGDDRGFVGAPGLNQEMGETVEALIEWCNDQGGINGRRIIGNRYDAAITNSASVMQRSCQRDFMLVGHGFGYDEAGEQFRVGCELPMVPAFAVGPNTAMGPNKYEPVPLPIDYYNGAMLTALMEVEPAFKTSLGMVGSSSPAVQLGLSRVVKAFGELEMNLKDCGVTIGQEGEANYVPFAQKLKNCDVETLWNTNSPSPIAFGLFEALQRVDADIQYVMETTWYSEMVREWNGQTGAVDGSLIGSMFQPLENADLIPGVQAYVDLVEKAGTTPSLLGMQATSAFLLWATAADACGADLTRDCVMAELDKISDWTGGGLHAPSNPGENMPTTCGMVLRLEGAEYAQVYPEERGEFFCDPGTRIELDPASAGVELDENRISKTFAKQ